MLSGGRLLRVVGAVAVAACSSSGDTSGVDAGPSNTLTCAGGGTSGVFRIADGTSLGSIAGATVTGPGCNAATSDDRGAIQVDLAQGQLLKLDVTASGYVPDHWEATPQASGFTKVVFMVPTSQKAALFTGWTGGNGYALVSVAGNGSDAGACSATDGVVASVKGHPEVQVGYLSDTVTRSASLSSMNTLGLAVLGPMPPGTYEFDATKAGCVAGPDHGIFFLWPQTLDVEADTLTQVQIKLP